MNEPHDILNRLAARARDEVPLQVDVQGRVMETLACRPRPVKTETTTLVVSVLAVATAACIVLALLPAWQAISEPWACYLQQ